MLYNAVLSRFMFQIKSSFHYPSSRFKQAAQKLAAILLAMSGLFIASNASADCIPIGSGSYFASFDMNIVTPSNGQTFTADSGGHANININGNVQMHTNLDSIESRDCVFSLFHPTVGYMIDGKYYSKGFIATFTENPRYNINLAPGTHTLYMRASTYFNPTPFGGSNTLYYDSTPITFKVVAAPKAQYLASIVGIVRDSNGGDWLVGYACNKGDAQQKFVSIFANGVSLVNTGAGMRNPVGANLNDDQICNTPGIFHGWAFQLSPYEASKAGQQLTVTGDNGPITGSGNFYIPTPTPVYPKPTISVTHTPAMLIAGQNFTLNWTTTNATSVILNCTSSGTGYSGSGPMNGVNGSFNAIASPAWVGYPSSCTWIATGPGGVATVNETYSTVAFPTISVTRTPLVAGQNYTITWSTTNATAVTYNCTASGTGYSGAGGLPSVNGTASGVASAAWVGYPSKCVWTATGPGGSASYGETLSTSQ